MKLHSKIITLISILVIIFTILISLIHYVEENKTNELLIERKTELQKAFDNTIKSTGKTIEVFSTDYTQWDEMVNFVNNRDPVWALENIEYPIESFKVNAVWVFDVDYNEVYKYNNLNSSQLNNFCLNKDELKSLFGKKLFNHFFSLINNELFEIRTAPIQPTSDVSRIEKPKGYFVVCKLWSGSVLKEISALTSSKIELENVTYSNTAKTEELYEIKVNQLLNDWQGNPIMRLVSTSDFPLLKKSNDVFNLQMLLGITFSISIFVTIAIFLFLTVSKPLRIIQNSLELQNPALLVSESKKKNEFGKLAQLIIQFFNQKEKLIDEEKQRLIAESSLTKSEEKYKKIFDNVQDVFYQTDLTGKIISVSPSIERYSEYKPEEVLGTNILDYYMDPLIRKQFIEEIKIKGELFDFEIYFVKKSGRVIPCSVNAHFIFENGRPYGIEGSLRDASERKKNEEQILKLSRAIEQSPISVIITDVAGNIEYVNPKFLETSGYSIEEIKDNNVDILKSGFMSEEVYIELWNTISRGNEWKGELLNKRKNGELYWENVFITPIKNAENIILNYLALKEDITEKKNIVEELKSAKEKAEEMNNIKSSFLANMSHELRTPMMGILGNAEIISLSTEDEEIKDMASAIYLSGKRLINTLNLILDLSRIEANKENLDVEKLEVVSIVNDVVEHFIPAAKQKGLDLRLITSNESLIAHLDERLLREILNNLINNAVKFTRVGGISVSLFNEHDKIIIKVLDTGIGIAPHSLGLIFEEFRQASEGYGRSFEGTGLGLTITKKFVEKLGGKIFVKSVIDKGSEFTVELPIEKEYAND